MDTELETTLMHLKIWPFGTEANTNFNLRHPIFSFRPSTFLAQKWKLQAMVVESSRQPKITNKRHNHVIILSAANTQRSMTRAILCSNGGQKDIMLMNSD